MKASDLFIPTSKEAPRDAHIKSHQLLIQAGYIRQVASGLYSYLPFGLRVLHKITDLIRTELQRLNFSEITVPMLVPKEFLLRSGRYHIFGENMMKTQDRNAQEYALGPTHEEHFAELVAQELRSYKSLPIRLYQIHYKFRDETRPRFGLMRTREFLMKDGYSFHASSECLDETYRAMRKAYTEIFRGVGLCPIILEADSGAMGGDGSEEFAIRNAVGEDVIVECSGCGYTSTSGSSLCPTCGHKLEETHIIELGHIFKLGNKYSQAHATHYIDPHNQKQNPLMGCYGIGIDRLIASIVEQHHDDAGIRWPSNIAPYQVVIVPVDSKNQDQNNYAQSLYNELIHHNIEAILENRPLRTGEKFNDWDLLGIPIRLVIGQKTLTEERIEVKLRTQTTSTYINKQAAPQQLANILQATAYFKK